MPQYNTMGIVLRRIAFGETDNILTLYTREHGRVSAIAKGARKAMSRLAGASEVLTCAHYSIASGKSLGIIAQAEVKNSFAKLRKDLIRLANAQYIVDLISHFVVEDDPQPEIFVLLRSTLMLLERIADPGVATRWFELRLLDGIGYAPDLSACIVCGEPLPGSFSADAQFGLSISQGGALCPYHARPREVDDHSALCYEALCYLQVLTSHETGHIRSVLLISSPTSTAAVQAKLALRRYIRYRCDSDLRSLVFLDGVSD